MATQRLIDASTTAEPDEALNWSLRPTTIADYVGQADLIERLRIAIAASKARDEPMEHILLHGPPGLGKTTLAHVIAQEMKSKVVLTSGPALARGTDLVAALTRLQQGDVLFIDEIHRLPIAVEEFIYPAMEDFRIDVTVDTGINARTVQIRVKPFTLIGATTRAGLLSSPLRSRFGIVHHLKYYTPGELTTILHRSCQLLGMTPSANSDDHAIDASLRAADRRSARSVQISDTPPRATDRGSARSVPSAPPTQSLTAALTTIAERSRGTPRIANRLLRRVRDFAQVRHNSELSSTIVDEALALEAIDALGLDELDRAYLRTIAGVYEGGPVGLDAIAATLNEDPGTLEDVVEPFLLQIGFLARTRRGRMMTRPAAEHLGLAWKPRPEQAALFE